VRLQGSANACVRVQWRRHVPRLPVSTATADAAATIWSSLGDARRSPPLLSVRRTPTKRLYQHAYYTWCFIYTCVYTYIYIYRYVHTTVVVIVCVTIIITITFVKIDDRGPSTITRPFSNIPRFFSRLSRPRAVYRLVITYSYITCKL